MVLGPGQGTPGWGTGNRSPRQPAVPPITLNSPLYEWASDHRLPNCLVHVLSNGNLYWYEPDTPLPEGAVVVGFMFR